MSNDSKDVSVSNKEPKHRTVPITFTDDTQSIVHHEGENLVAIRFADDPNAADIVAKICEQYAVESPVFVTGLYLALVKTPAFKRSEALRFRVNAIIQDARKRSERLNELLDAETSGVAATKAK